MTIRIDVENDHLKNFPEERNLLNPFLDGFEITWGKRVPSHNTFISVYFLLPRDHYKESYGFDNEIMLVYSPYKNMEPRTLQAVEQVFTQSPAKGRVETLNYFLISDDIEIESWLDRYNSSKQESKIIIPFSKDEILSAKGNQWFIRNKLNRKFFGRDLFNYSLPLIEDSYFFGRQSLVMEYFDSIRKNENRGVFGLRKTGKTSLLFKVKRFCEANTNDILILYFDCKQPHIRKSRWFELLEEVSSEIQSKINIRHSYDFSEKKASKSFISLIELIKNNYNKSVCLMFDEIEYISFLSPTDAHWKSDYLEFWQTLWSAQSQVKGLSLIIGGVNSTVVEQDLIINDIQNPLFGIVPSHYITGFSDEECKIMLRKLGRRMGLDFDISTCTLIRDWYGGHPLLIRLACSQLNLLLSKNQDKPFKITDDVFNSNKDDIDQELIYYSNHAISEIKLFYPDDYYMFELLSTGQELEFNELVRDTNLIGHLIDYQLINKDTDKYKINIPVISKRVAHDFQKKNGTELIYPIVSMEKRESWLYQRIANISKEFSQLDRLVQKNNGTKLFGSNSFPEGVELQKSTVVKNKSDFSNFINTLNRCFVESVEKYGRDQNIKNYFTDKIKLEYIYLWEVLYRIKVYRHDLDHLHLTPNTTEKYLQFIKEDFENKSFSEITDPFFILQQRLLDRLLLGLRQEIDVRS
ncbi:hypothetical protein [Neisseria animaloris]|uniref:hypothetical protein n=1 Tax=Neisseria animaloris TaxID=326522 RepID=UPI0039E1E236